MAVTTTPRVGVFRRVVEHDDGSITIESQNTKYPVAWTVAVDSEGLNDDRIDLYVVIARDEVEAKALAELEFRSDYPMHQATGSEAYRLGLDTSRVLGRLVPEDER